MNSLSDRGLTQEEKAAKIDDHEEGEVGHKNWEHSSGYVVVVFICLFACLLGV